MSSLQRKIDFALIFSVDHANPNGDPLNDNRPRTDYEGFGEVTDVCLKRKLRDRLQEAGQAIFVQSDEKKTDGYASLKARAEDVLGKDTFNAKKTKPEEAARKACETWFDVRAFGQLFAFGKDKSSKKANKASGVSNDEANEKSKGVSIPIRGPLTIRTAFSVAPVVVTSTQITKSTSSEEDGSRRDTMGMKHRVDRGVYVTYGSINPQLAERTGFSDEDAAAVKAILPRLFENDASSARPEGSMRVLTVFWWEHNSKLGQYSSARVHESLTVREDGTYGLAALEGLPCEEIDGF